MYFSAEPPLITLLASCSKQEAVIDTAQQVADKDYNASKALYYSLKLSIQPQFRDLGKIYAGESRKVLSSLGNPANLLSSPIFTALSSVGGGPNARGNAEEAKSKLVELAKYSESYGKLSKEGSKILKDFANSLYAFKSKNEGDPKEELLKLIGAHEENVHKSQSLIDSDRQVLLASAVGLEGQLDNMITIGSKTFKNGRCWLCSIFNVVATVVVAAFIVAVVVAIIAVVAGVAGAALASAVLFAAGVGATFGAISAATDECWQVINYGQPSPYYVALDIFDLGPC